MFQGSLYLFGFRVERVRGFGAGIWGEGFKVHGRVVSVLDSGFEGVGAVLFS